MANTFLPIHLSLKDRNCLVVGGGDIALRKIETLLEYDCRITVIAPKVAEKIEYFAKSNRLQLVKREYVRPEASEYGMAIAASNDIDVNRTVFEDCRAVGVPVNTVDNPALCDFIFPAVVKRNSLTVAVGTDGKAPFLAGQLRLILEEVFPERWGKIADLAESFRIKVRKKWKNDRDKMGQCYQRFCAADWKKLLKEKDAKALEEELENMLDE